MNATDSSSDRSLVDPICYALAHSDREASPFGAMGRPRFFRRVGTRQQVLKPQRMFEVKEFQMILVCRYAFRQRCHVLVAVLAGLLTSISFSSTSRAAASTASPNKVIIPSVSLPRSPFIPTGETFNGIDGNRFSGSVASFLASASSKASDFYAVITWGDGTKSNGTIVMDGRGAYHVAGMHSYSEVGKYITSVKITESGIGSVVATGIAKVADAPIVPTSINKKVTLKGTKSFSGVVGTFEDKDPLNTHTSNYTGAVTWGDGTSSTLTFVRAGIGQWSILGNHKFAKTGTYTVKLSVRDIGGAGPISETVTITVP